MIQVSTGFAIRIPELHLGTNRYSFNNLTHF